MNTQNLSTLKIHKLTQEQYDREVEAGNIDETALYLTPDEEITADQIGAVTKEEFNEFKADSIAPDTIIECGPFYNYNNDSSSSQYHYIGYWFKRRLDGTFTMKFLFWTNDISIEGMMNPMYYCFWQRLPFCIFEVNNVVLDLDEIYPIDADNKKYFVGEFEQEDYPSTGLPYEIPGVSDNAHFYINLTEPSIFNNLPEQVTTFTLSGYATITGRWRE